MGRACRQAHRAEAAQGARPPHIVAGVEASHIDEASLSAVLPRRVVPIDIDVYATLFERFDDAIP